jgi:hypothetical protein
VTCENCGKEGATFTVVGGPDEGHVFCDPKCQEAWHNVLDE